ncbi:MAG: hypothetical protein ABW321_18160 [Polyangiales bacterium]
MVVSHITTHHGTAAAAESYHDFETRVMRERAPDFVRSGGLFVIHDWRMMETYDVEARRVWQARMRAHERGYLRGSVVCVARANPLLRMAVQAANLAASLVQSGKVELSEDIDAALKTHGLHHPPLPPAPVR